MDPEIAKAMHPANHKTIFVLDHTPFFGTNCESLIEFDFTKSRGPGFIPLAPIAKSLWTCSVEAAIEYCRIVWDLFPTGKLVRDFSVVLNGCSFKSVSSSITDMFYFKVRFIVSDTKSHSLNTWSPVQQSLSHVSNLNFISNFRHKLLVIMESLCIYLYIHSYVNLWFLVTAPSTRPIINIIIVNRSRDILQGFI
jgi:hypothetical protein